MKKGEITIFTPLNGVEEQWRLRIGRIFSSSILFQMIDPYRNIFVGFLNLLIQFVQN